MDFRAGDVAHLEALEKDGTFSPVGWLYLSIMRDLGLRGLVRADGYNNFKISELGKAALAGYRLGKSSP